ncbi:MAG TPA: TcmI family type II polyketide cyclase [Jatrophihabitans sp.]|jgi:cyclase|uniref:TcmI family type II polyketide cyclase n=1 Tax=Jatrophihabitans sp. TaxID=1932789 RepID=UPI002F1CF50F
MDSTLIVARLSPRDICHVEALFAEFDATDMPHRMGTVRRQLFHFHGLYFHIQDFAAPNGGERIEAVKEDPAFAKISQDLRPFIDPYDPGWKSPKDAMATRFYSWQGGPL